MAGSTKSILLSYLERNKIIKVPLIKDTTDLAFIRDEFIKVFTFGKNVGLCLSFQKYDSGWEDYVKIDDTEELTDREKIKVVVIPVLSTPAASDVCSTSVLSESDMGTPHSDIPRSI